MAKITVTVREDIGDPGEHRIYGKLEPGASMSIDEEHFGAGIFTRPAPDYLSPHEAKDKERANEKGIKVGDFEPDPPTPKNDKPAKAGKE